MSEDDGYCRKLELRTVARRGTVEVHRVSVQRWPDGSCTDHFTISVDGSVVGRVGWLSRAREAHDGLIALLNRPEICWGE